MAKVLLNKFEQLILEAKESTANYAQKSPLAARTRSMAEAAKLGLDKVKAGLDLGIPDNHDINSVLDPNSRGLRKNVLEDLSIENNPESKKNITVVVNWLVMFTKKIINKIEVAFKFLNGDL